VRDSSAKKRLRISHVAAILVCGYWHVNKTTLKAV
jgi:hypothetical protein